MLSVYEIEILVSLLPIKLKKTATSWIGRCPFHDDQTPSFRVSKRSGYWKCYGCHEEGSIWTLTRRLLGASADALLGYSGDQFRSLMFQRTMEEGERDRSQFPVKPKIEYVGRFRSPLEDPECLQYCRDRHISDEIIEAFELKYSEISFINGTRFSKRLITPIREHGELLAYEGRDITRRAKPKVLYPKGGDVSTLFRLDELKKKETLIVTEGLMDIPLLWEKFSKNTTCTFGSGLSPEQIDLLEQFDDLVLFIDDDEAGHGELSFLFEARSKDFKVAVVPGKDPGAATEQELEEALENSLPVADFLIRKSGLFEDESVDWSFNTEPDDDSET